MIVGQAEKYSKAVLLSFVEQDMSVSEMAITMKADIEEVIACYAQYSREDRNAFPLKLLLTKEWLEYEMQTSKVADICRKAKTNPAVVKSYCKKYGIQSKQIYLMQNIELSNERWSANDTCSNCIERTNCDCYSMWKMYN